MAEIKFVEISFEKSKEEIKNWLQKLYNKAEILFTPASPYGQVLSVLEELNQLSYLYLKNSINQFDLSNANSNNFKLIRTEAIVAGHIPSRSISATGTLRFKIRASTDVEKDIPGGKITITNKTLIKNKTNSLDYTIDLGGSDKVTYQVNPGVQFFVNIIQGKWESTQFTGTGEDWQSFVANIPGNKDIENFNVQVQVNGENWSLKKHPYEMLSDEKACVVRTGFNGGIDIIFGNSSFGLIPTIGSIIRVSYIQSDGSRGNIFRRTINDFRIIDDIIDGFGNTIDITQYFDCYISTDINFGADSESIKFTKSIIPMASTNYVLALPQQYAYQIKRLGVFSHVNAYEQFGTIIIVATPNIKLFKNQNKDYFNIDKAAFELDNYEKSKLDKYLKISGNIQLTKRYKISSPVLSYYIINLFIIVYSDANMENVKNQIYDKISDYFLNFNRIDRVPKKDIINKISEITDIDSVDISFTSKKNEDYHREFILASKNTLNVRLANPIDLFDPKENPRYNPNEVRGLDPILGDIIFDPNEVPIIRGGWYDRNNIFYSESLETSGFSSVNIIKKGTTDVKNKNLI